MEIPPTPSESFSSKIVGDTTMPNGKTYFIKTTQIFPYSGPEADFVRVDDSANVYVYITNNNDCPDSEYNIFRLAAHDSTRWSVCVEVSPDSSDFLVLDFTSDIYYAYLGDSFSTKSFSGWNSLAFPTFRLAKGIGIVQIIGEAAGSIVLSGAIIDGMQYGEVTSVAFTPSINSKSTQPGSLDTYPNPFNMDTMIQYRIDLSSKVNIVVYDLLGRMVAEIEDQYRSPGLYYAKFDARDLPSGIYILTLLYDGQKLDRKILLLK